MHLDGAFALFDSVRIFLLISETVINKLYLQANIIFEFAYFTNWNNSLNVFTLFQTSFPAEFNSISSRKFSTFSLDADKLLHLTDTQSYLPKDQKYAKAEILQN